MTCNRNDNSRQRIRKERRVEENEDGVDGGGIFWSHLFSGAVGTLASGEVISGAMEGHELVTGALSIKHLVTTFNGYLVQLDGTPCLRGLQNF